MKRLLGLVVLAGVIVSLVAVVAGWSTFAYASGAVTILGAAVLGIDFLRSAHREQPPDLLLEQVGGLGSQTGFPRYVKAKLKVINQGPGPARNWQAAISDAGIAGVKVARLQYRGPRQYMSEIEWHQDATTGEVPSGQDRELSDWLWVELPNETDHASLGVSLKSDNMKPKFGTLVVDFPSGGAPSVRFEI